MKFLEKTKMKSSRDKNKIRKSSVQMHGLIIHQVSISKFWILTFELLCRICKIMTFVFVEIVEFWLFELPMLMLLFKVCCRGCLNCQQWLFNFFRTYYICHMTQKFDDRMQKNERILDRSAAFTNDKWQTRISFI